MEPNIQLHVQDHTLSPTAATTPPYPQDDLGSKDRQQKRPPKYKPVSIKLLGFLVASACTLLVILGAALYIALVNKEFRWYIFYPILVYFIVSSISLVVAKAIHCLNWRLD